MTLAVLAVPAAIFAKAKANNGVGFVREVVIVLLVLVRAVSNEAADMEVHLRLVLARVHGTNFDGLVRHYTDNLERMHIAVAATVGEHFGGWGKGNVFHGVTQHIRSQLKSFVFYRFIDYSCNSWCLYSFTKLFRC